MRRTFLPLFLAAASSVAAMAAPPLPLQQAHSHNDYEQKRPLAAALESGFCSVEADIHLVNGQLLVAHDRVKTRPERTLKALYLDPLRERCRTNGGFVHPATNRFTLLIDIKADAEGTYRVLDPLLREYQSILTRFTPTQTTPGAITVILSGARPTATVAAQSERFCAIDGRPEDLDSNPPAHLVPLVSDSWSNHFKTPVDGRLSAADRDKLRAFVARTHAQGRRLRFWGAPDRPWLWNELREANVDIINTDRLPHLAAFLRGEPPPQSAPATDEQ
jgi:hypothetical protein